MVSLAGRFESLPSPANRDGISIAGRFESELLLPALMVSLAARFESEPSPANPGDFYSWP